MTWMPLEVGSLFRTVTYLLVSIYRFHMLASVSKAAAKVEVSTYSMRKCKADRA